MMPKFRPTLIATAAALALALSAGAHAGSNTEVKISKVKLHPDNPGGAAIIVNVDRSLNGAAVCHGGSRKVAISLSNENQSNLDSNTNRYLSMLMMAMSRDMTVRVIGKDNCIGDIEEVSSIQLYGS